MIREATIEDIPAMHIVRMSVRENVLSNPLLVTQSDYEKYITTQGKGWVYEMDNKIAGFAIIDVPKKNIWALFVHPEHEGRGIGLKLQQQMLDWFFASYNDELNLSTSPGTRAAQFYKRSGWREDGFMKSGEIIFKMLPGQWNSGK